MNDLQLGWWAGLWEGRGTLSRNVQGNGTVTWTARITGSNKGMIDRAHLLLNGAGAVSVEGPRPRMSRGGKVLDGNRPTQYRLTIINRADLRALLEALRPMLTDERRAEADEFLTWVRDQPTVPRREQGVRRKATP